MTEEQNNNELSKIHKTLFGDDEELGLKREVKMLSHQINQHLIECSKRAEEFMKKTSEKRLEDLRFYKGILGSIITAAISGSGGMIAIAFKVWAKTP